MKPWLEEDGVTLYHGGALGILRLIPDASIECCVTSPPYWGLRDYGTATWINADPECDHLMLRETGQRADRTHTQRVPYKDVCGRCGGLRVDEQIGLEATPQEFVAKLVAVFEEVRRVLKPDGTCWVNLGDSYAGGGCRSRDPERWPKQSRNDHIPKHVKAGSQLAAKQLIGIPWRVSFALQETGWWLRSDIIWAKPAPMPESVTDRPTRSHEYIFLLAKSERYYYDFEAIKEPSVADHGSGNGFKRDARLTFGGRGSDEPWSPSGKNAVADPQHSGRRMTESVARARANGANHDSPFGATRNKRDVWTVNSDPFPEAHFATFPPDLIRPCILAGCPVGGTVLDPFMGSGTTALVAKENRRKAVGIDLNAEYLEIARRRICQSVLAF